jgi:hypothetical protein
MGVGFWFNGMMALTLAVLFAGVTGYLYAKDVDNNVG